MRVMLYEARSAKGLFSIALRALGFLVRSEATSHSSQALCLFIERINFFIEPSRLGFRLFSAAQLFECFANREFSGVSHCKTSSCETAYKRKVRIPLKRC